MFFRHSMIQTIRSWRRSLLFLVLLTLLTAVLGISVGLGTYIRSFLNACRESYTTIGVLEYMGDDYPDDSQYDPAISACYDPMDWEAMKFNDAVEVWDPTGKAFGYVEGRMDKNCAAAYPNNGVLVIYVTDYVEQESVHVGTVVDSLYSYDDVLEKRLYIDGMGQKLEEGRYYLVHGAFYDGPSSYLYFRVLPFVNQKAEQSGFDGSLGEMCLDVTAQDGYQIPASSSFASVAETYAVLNSGVTVYATEDLAALYPFQQNLLQIQEGRVFETEEYKEGARVCVLSEDVAKALGKGVGDTVTLSLAISPGCSLDQSYWEEAGFTDTAQYTVVGTVNVQDNWSNSVYIPSSDRLDLTKTHLSYTMVQMELDNDSAAAFAETVRPLLPQRTRFTIYDQGYASATEPMKDMLQMITIVTVISAAAGAAILILFGYLFVFRQRDSARIMRRLGVGTHQIHRYFLFGAGTVAFLGAAVGAVLSLACAQTAWELVQEAASDTGSDYWYSNGNLSMEQIQVFSQQISAAVFMAVGAAVFLLSLLSCVLFTMEKADQVYRMQDGVLERYR